jgi:hypothetical protein
MRRTVTGRASLLPEAMEPERSGDSLPARQPEGRAEPGNQPNLIKLKTDPNGTKLSPDGAWSHSPGLRSYPGFTNEHNDLP